MRTYTLVHGRPYEEIEVLGEDVTWDKVGALVEEAYEQLSSRGFEWRNALHDPVNHSDVEFFVRGDEPYTEIEYLELSWSEVD